MVRIVRDILTVSYGFWINPPAALFDQGRHLVGAAVAAGEQNLHIRLNLLQGLEHFTPPHPRHHVIQDHQRDTVLLVDK